MSPLTPEVQKIQKEFYQFKPLTYLFRKLVFFCGNVRFHKPCPSPVSSDKIKHLISHDEIDSCIKKLKPGDIIIHRDRGYLGNYFIDGIGIHAGIYLGTWNGKPNQVIEALSDDEGGVVIRNARYILHSDYAWASRPKKKITFERSEVDVLEGFPYDFLFNFNTAEQWEIIRKFGKQEAIKQGVRICCTEVVALLYEKELKNLGIYPTRNEGMLVFLLSLLGIIAGRYIYHADTYLQADGLEWVWASESVTEEWLKKKKAPLKMISLYRQYKEKTGSSQN